MRKYVIFMLPYLTLMFLSGCSQLTDMPSQTEPEESVQRSTEGFAVEGKLEEEETFWAGQYLPWEHKDRNSDAKAEELICLDSGVCGKSFWYLGREESMELGAKVEYTLEIYDTVSGQSTIKQFTPGELGLEGELGYLDSMDMLDEKHYAFRWVDYELDEKGLYCQNMDQIVYTGLEGDFLGVDLMESYLEKGFYQKDFTEQPSLQVLNWCCDGKGNICVTDYKETGKFLVCLFGPSGEELLEYEGTAEQQVVEPLRTPEGELIFPVYDSTGKGYEFLRADTVEREMYSLVCMEASYPSILQMYGMLGDDIYYRSREAAADGIVKWNVKSGRRVRVFDFQGAGIETGYEIMLALREGQPPVLRLSRYQEGKQKEWLAVLMEQKPAEDGIIRVADLAAYGGAKAQVAACAALASIETPDFRYEYEDASAQENRDRILVELSQGKGPDLLFVPLEDMYLLEEKGLLLDIGELISKELQEELLPGALDIGAVDGKILGVPAAVQGFTLAVADDIWPENTWRLENMIDLMAEGELTGAIRTNDKYTEPSLTVLLLVNYNMENSFLIDWENRKSHFDDERFIRLLELTCTDMKNAPVDTDVWLNEGKDIFWGEFYSTADFLDFYEHMEAEAGKVVGYPTEGACGSYLVADGVLVVNADIAQKEAAAFFLETLLGEELQSKATTLCMSVRKLIPEDYIVEEESGRLLYMGNGQMEMAVFDDGATALHRAKAFLENCVASPHRDSQITRILAEELSAMHVENRSPQTTADMINRRVQIYLDEGG